MSNLEQAARQALEALEKTGIEGTGEMHDAAIAALREALEQQPKQKPVAWWNPKKDTVSCDPVHRHHPDCVPLYTVPPKREWVGLTDEEIGTLTVFDGLHHVETPLLADFARAVEAKLKELNT